MELGRKKVRLGELERIILDDGWVLSDIRGDIPLRVVSSIFKQAGLK